MAVHAARQLAASSLELRIAARAAPPSRGPKIRHRGAAKRALGSVSGRREHLLLHLVEKLSQRVLRKRVDGRLDAPLRSAALAEVQLHHHVVLDRRQLNHGVVLMAIVANHQGTTSAVFAAVKRPSSSRRVRRARRARERLWVTITIAI